MRNLDPAIAAALSTSHLQPVILCMLTFVTGPQYVWSGVGTLVYDAQAYVGVGSFGQIGSVSEGTDVHADGTTVSLSGIDPALSADAMNEVQLGAPAKLWLGLVSQGAVVGAPYLLFAGVVDQPLIDIDPTSGKDTITLALETLLSDLQRASNRRYTSADQRIAFPNDSGFSWVELENDIALRIGS